MEKLWNALRFSLKRILIGLTEKNIHFEGVGRVSLRARIHTANGGAIYLKAKTRIFENVRMTADGGQLTLGKNVDISRNSTISCHGEIVIGDGCLFAPNVGVFDHDHKFSYEGLEPGYSVGTIHIGNNCWLGTNVIILKNTVIGDCCVIGAGCVVKGVVPPHTIVKCSRELELIPIKED